MMWKCRVHLLPRRNKDKTVFNRCFHVSLILLNFDYFFNSTVQDGAKTVFVYGVILGDMPVLLDEIPSEDIGKIKTIAHQCDTSFEMDALFHVLGNPVLVLTAQLLSVIKKFPVICKPCSLSGLPIPAHPI